MRQEELFDVSMWKQDLGVRFSEFEELAIQLLGMTVRSGRGALDIGRIVKELQNKFGVSIWQQFTKVKKLHPAKYYRTCERLYDKFGDEPISDEMSVQIAEFIATVPEKNPLFDQCVDILRDSGDWKKFYDERKENFENGDGWIPHTEADVRRGLIQWLQNNGHEIISEDPYVPTNGLRPDVISRKNGILHVWECKKKLTLPRLQQAQGQTEQIAWQFENPIRGIAFAMIDPEVITHAREAAIHGIQVKQVNLVIQESDIN